MLEDHDAERNAKEQAALEAARERAAEAAATAPEPLQVSNPAHLRDLAASAARIFGWDTEKKPGVQLNQQFVISTEQLQEIRALREQADAQERP